MMKEQHDTEIHWKGILVGHLLESMPDMWYLEGRWVPLKIAEASIFTDLVSNFDMKAVFRDLTKGTRIKLRYEIGGKLFDGVAISISEGNLFLRRIFDTDAIKWATENIPE